VAAAHLTDSGGSQAVAIHRAGLEQLRGRKDFYWLDLHGPSGEEVELLGEVFGFHPLTIEDAQHFGQRPKLESYDGYVFLVVFGAAPDPDNLVEVHCFYSDRFLVTVRRDPCPAFREARERQDELRRELSSPSLVLHGLVDRLVDSFFPLLSEFDELIDVIEEGIFDRPDEIQLRRISELRRRLVHLRRVIAPQRDLVGTIARGSAELPGWVDEADHAFRDVYDHLIRLTDSLEIYRDVVAGEIELYHSTVANRQNAIVKQLTAIASIFLPLSFITGYFGQNFGWMVDAVGGAAEFFVLGIGVQVLALLLLLAWFKRRGWF
jgi:magnesium transporter